MLQAGNTAQQRTLCAIPVRELGTGESSAGNSRGQLQAPKKTPNPQQPPCHHPGGKKKVDKVGVSEGDPHYDEISINA